MKKHPPIRTLCLCAFVALTLVVTGCATNMESTTTGPDGEVLKTTKVEHTWWLGLPCIAPMDATIYDGEFKAESRAFRFPDGWFGLMRRD